jgi:hypothetical protein
VKGSSKILAIFILAVVVALDILIILAITDSILVDWIIAIDQEKDHQFQHQYLTTEEAYWVQFMILSMTTVVIGFIQAAILGGLAEEDLEDTTAFKVWTVIGYLNPFGMLYGLKQLADKYLSD